MAFQCLHRNSTLELLNKLNAKYSLGFGEIKNKILIFPGGMEFMRVIYELSRLAMRITLKRNGINEPENQPYVKYNFNLMVKNVSKYSFNLILRKFQSNWINGGH